MGVHEHEQMERISMGIKTKTITTEEIGWTPEKIAGLNCHIAVVYSSITEHSLQVLIRMQPFSDIVDVATFYFNSNKKLEHVELIDRGTIRQWKRKKADLIRIYNKYWATG